MKEYWSKLLDGAAPIRLYSKPGMEYNMGNLETFLFDQAGAAAMTWIKLHNNDLNKFMDRLQEKPFMPNPKYKQLLQQYGKL